MANEIKDLQMRVEAEMKSGMLTKGTRLTIVDFAMRGEQFSVKVSMADALRMQRRLYYYGHQGVMHQQLQPDGTTQVTFNI